MLENKSCIEKKIFSQFADGIIELKLLQISTQKLYIGKNTDVIIYAKTQFLVRIIFAIFKGDKQWKSQLKLMTET